MNACSICVDEVKKVRRLGHCVAADHDAVHAAEEVVTAVAVGSEITNCQDYLIFGSSCLKNDVQINYKKKHTK